MKRGTVSLIFNAGIIALFFAFTQSLYAQDQKGQSKPRGEAHQNQIGKQQGGELQGPFANYTSIPGLTEKQKGDIKAIRIEMLKDIKTLKDQINEKEAALRTLTRAEEYDSKAAEKLIDEISLLQAENRKRVERARNQIRNILNEEQKLWFDQHCQARPAGQKRDRSDAPPKKMPPRRK